METFKQSAKCQIYRSKKFSMNGKSVIAFMPIKPMYANGIIRGEKKYEFRRSPVKPNLTHIIIYSTYPIKKIIGVAAVGKVSSASPTATWRSVKHAAGISRLFFREYFKGCKVAFAISIERVASFERWIDPRNIESSFKVPQAFSYVDNEFFRRTLRVAFQSRSSTSHSFKIGSTSDR